MNTEEGCSPIILGTITDQYAVKLLTSGFKLEQVRRIIVAGLKGHENRLKQSKAEGRAHIHRSAKESQGARNRKKLFGKAEWFKGGRKGGAQLKEEPSGAGGGNGAETL